MAITVIDGPTAAIAGEQPTGLVRLTATNALAVAGPKAILADISGGTISLGTQATIDTASAIEAKSILVDSASSRVVTVNWIPSRYLRASIVTPNLGLGTLSSSAIQLRDSFTENPSYPVMTFGGAACLYGSNVAVFWHEYDSFIAGSGTWKSFWMEVTVSGGSLSAGSAVEYHSMTVPAGPDVSYGVVMDAIPTGPTSAILLMSNGSYRTFSSGSIGSATAAVTTFPSKTGAQMSGGLVVCEANTGAVATFFNDSFVGVSANSQIVNDAVLSPLQSRTAIATGPQTGARVLINGSSYDSVDSGFTYDGSGGSAGYPQAMGLLNDQLLVLNAHAGAASLTLLGGVPTSDPFGFDGGNRLWVYKITRESGGGYTITSRGVKT